MQANKKPEMLGPISGKPKGLIQLVKNPVSRTNIFHNQTLQFMQKTAYGRGAARMGYRDFTKILLVMKLTIMLLTAAFLQVHANGVAQTITLSSKNLELKRVFGEIKKQTGYVVFYNTLDLEGTRPVTLSVSKMPLNDFLSLMLAGQPLSYKIEDRTIMLFRSAAKPPPVPTAPVMQDTAIVITGKVTNDQNQGLDAVTVTARPSGKSAITGPDGVYSISISTRDRILVFSSVGFQSAEGTITATRVVNSVLEKQVSGLGEVVVVGYGTQRKSDITAAISTVNVKNLEKQPTADLGTMLQGQVPGVIVSAGSGNPTGTPVILIRGLNSFNKQKPLYVIDGVPIDYAFDLNPGDIETISILKDASAATIYGARASAGVIIVSTKKGKSGEPKINYNGYFSSNKLANDIPVMNKVQTNRVLREIAANDGTPLPPYAADDSKFGNTDWAGAYFKRAFEQKHDVDVSAGSEKMTYRVSYSHWENSGIIINSGSKRDNIRLTSSINMLNNRLKITPILSYTRFNNKDFSDATGDGNAGFSDIMNIYSQLPHKLIYDPASPNGYAKAPAELGVLGNGNPIGQRMLAQNRTNNDYFQANVSADLKLWKGLSYTFTYAKTINNYYGYSQIDPYNFGATAFVEFPARAESRSRDDISVMTSLLNYNLEIGKHNFKALAGYSREEKVEKGTTAGGNHLYSQLNEVLSRLVISAPGDYITAGGWNLTKRLQSGFGRLNYNYDDRYFLQASVRRDGSSKFGPLNRYGTFWSVSGGWAVHNEKFFNSAIISELKPRVSYGTLGNEDIPPFLYLSGISIGRGQLNYPLGNLLSQAVSVGAIATTLGNNNIKWEQTATFKRVSILDCSKTKSQQASTISTQKQRACWPLSHCLLHPVSRPSLPMWLICKTMGGSLQSPTGMRAKRISIST